MKQLLPNNKYSNVDNYSALIDDFLNDLKVDPYKNYKKILEVCHVGKFLMFLKNQYQIEKLNEEPDFIIVSKSRRIGLEHLILIDPTSKEKEGFFGNLCKLA